MREASPTEQFPRNVSATAMLPRFAVGRIDVALNALWVPCESQLDGSGVCAGNVRVVRVDEYALGF